MTHEVGLVVFSARSGQPHNGSSARHGSAWHGTAGPPGSSFHALARFPGSQVVVAVHGPHFCARLAAQVDVRRPPLDRELRDVVRSAARTRPPIVAVIQGIVHETRMIRKGGRGGGPASVQVGEPSAAARIWLVRMSRFSTVPVISSAPVSPTTRSRAVLLFVVIT